MLHTFCSLDLITNTSSYEKMPTGVRQTPSGTFEASIKYVGKTRYIGTFNSKEEAVQGRKLAQEVLQKACAVDGTDEEKEAKAKQNVDLAKEAANKRGAKDDAGSDRKRKARAIWTAEEEKALRALAWPSSERDSGRKF